MGNNIEINDYIIELDPDANKISKFDSIIKNLEKMGKKAHLLKFISSIYQLGLPYKHNIYISDDGEVTIDIFEKNHELINPPEKLKIGIIQNYRN